MNGDPDTNATEFDPCLLRLHPFIRIYGTIGALLPRSKRRARTAARYDPHPRVIGRGVFRDPLLKEHAMSIRSRFLAVSAVFLATAGLAMTAAPTTPIAMETFGGDAFPLTTCPVSGEALGADAVTVVLTGMSDKNLDGTQIRFCCTKCEAAFKADPAKYTAKMNEAIIAAASPYPLTNCISMKDEVLDDSAKSVVYQNRVYKLCCKKCVVRFEKSPAKLVAEYEAAVIKAQKPTYALATCPISGKPLGEGAVDVVVGTRLVRVCCAGCVGPVKADAKAAFAKIDATSAAPAAPAASKPAAK